MKNVELFKSFLAVDGQLDILDSQAHDDFCKDVQDAILDILERYPKISYGDVIDVLKFSTFKSLTKAMEDKNYLKIINTFVDAIKVDCVEYDYEREIIFNIIRYNLIIDNFSELVKDSILIANKIMSNKGKV